MRRFDFNFNTELGESILNKADQFKNSSQNNCDGLMSIRREIRERYCIVESEISNMIRSLKNEISSMYILEERISKKRYEIETKKKNLIPPHWETVEIKDSEGNVVDKKNIFVDPHRAQREKYDLMIEKCGKFIDRINENCAICQDAQSELTSYKGDFESHTIENRCEWIEHATKYIKSDIFELERNVKYAIDYVKKIERCSSDFKKLAFTGRKVGRLPNIFLSLQSGANVNSTFSNSSYRLPVSSSSAISSINSRETHSTNDDYITFRVVYKLIGEELRLNYDKYTWNTFEDEFIRYKNKTQAEFIIKVSTIGISRRNANGWDEFVNNIAKYGFKYEERDGLPKLNINKEAIFKICTKE